MKRRTMVVSASLATGIAALAGQRACQTPTLTPADPLTADVCVPKDAHCVNSETGEDHGPLMLVFNATKPDGIEVELRGYVSPGEAYRIGRSELRVPDATVRTRCEASGLTSEPALVFPTRAQGLESCGIVDLQGGGG